MDMTSPRPESPPHGYGPFAHLTAPNVLIYRSVMRAFLGAKERFAVHLRPEDVQAALPAGIRPGELDAVVKALDSLVGWGNLRADPDTGRVTAGTACRTGACSLSVFAADTLGSAHALDDGTPLATIALSGVRALTGHPDGAGAAWRRAAWAPAGLLRDDVSSTVLDWGGLRIATTLLQHVPWRPWRYTADDYRAAVAAAGPVPPPLTGKPALSPWDTGLAPALAEHGARIEEEAVTDVLPADLGR